MEAVKKCISIVTGDGCSLMKTYRIWVQHNANPLHIYCRLIDIGFSAEFSRRLGVLYERHFFPANPKGLKAKWTSRIKEFWLSV